MLCTLVCLIARISTTYITTLHRIVKRFITSTQCLLKKGVVARPPSVPMPNDIEFVQDTSYSSGLNPFGKKRVLNTVEIGLVYQALEVNITGTQLMTGFAQVAENPDVK